MKPHAHFMTNLKKDETPNFKYVSSSYNGINKKFAFTYSKLLGIKKIKLIRMVTKIRSNEEYLKWSKTF